MAEEFVTSLRVRFLLMAYPERCKTTREKMNKEEIQQFAELVSKIKRSGGTVRDVGIESEVPPHLTSTLEVIGGGEPEKRIVFGFKVVMDGDPEEDPEIDESENVDDSEGSENSADIEL